MALFRYEAVDKSGKVVRGVMNASSEQQVAQNLASMGYSARGVYGPGGSPPRATAPSTSSVAVTGAATGMQRVKASSGVPVSVRSKVPAPQLAMFFRQLTTLVRSGIPLQQSFHDMARVARNGRLRSAVPQMHDTLRSGQPLSTAMAAFPDLFPAHTIASVWCGELSGKLDTILDEVADDMEQEASDTRLGRIGWGITKAYFIFFILTLPMYTLMGSLASRVLGDNPVGASNAQGLMGDAMRDIFATFVRVCLPLAIALILIWVAWGHIKRVPGVRRLLDGALLRAPVWGKVHRYRSVSRFLHLLDLLYAAGINPSRAWDAASVAPRNSEIAEKLRAARNSAPASMGVSDLAALSGVLEPDEVALIAAGEKTGQVPDTLSRLSVIYDEKARLQKSTARILSISLMNASAIAMLGAAVIIVAKTYVSPILRFMGLQ